MMGWLIIYGIGVIISFVILAIADMNFKECEMSIPSLLFYSIIWPVLMLILLVAAIVELIKGDDGNG